MINSELGQEDKQWWRSFGCGKSFALTIGLGQDQPRVRCPYKRELCHECKERMKRWMDNATAAKTYGLPVTSTELAAMTFDDWQRVINNWAESKGWNTDARDFSEWTALFHTEISEAYEEFRSNRDLAEIYYGEDGKPEGIPIELADLAIRVLHFFARNGISLNEAINRKMYYNAGRPFRHGGKRT